MPLRTAMPSPRPNHCGSLSCRPDEVELGAEIGFQETLGESDVIGEREVEPAQGQIDEDLVGIAIAPDRSRSRELVGQITIVNGAALYTDRLARKARRRDVGHSAPARHEAIRCLVVLVCEVDPSQPLLGDRHRRYCGIDSPFLQRRQQRGELERNELALALRRGAKRPRDFDIETLELALIIGEAERRSFVLDPNAEQRGIICSGGACEPLPMPAEPSWRA